MSVILESESPLLFSKEGPGVVGQLLMLTRTVEFSITILEPPLNPLLKKEGTFTQLPKLYL